MCVGKVGGVQYCGGGASHSSGEASVSPEEGDLNLQGEGKNRGEGMVGSRQVEHERAFSWRGHVRAGKWPCFSELGFLREWSAA